MQVSQIYLTDDADQAFSPFLLQATRSVKQSFPGAAYKVYGKAELRSFIEQNYSDEVLWAYDKLLPYAYKADLGRYCLLNKLGGWYFDISVRIATPLTLDASIQMVAFRDIPRLAGVGWAHQNGVLFAQPGNPILQAAIAGVVRNCREEYYGYNALCPTGPILFGETLAAQRGKPPCVFGDFVELTPHHPNKNKAFVFRDGTIFALNKPCEGGDLTAIGARGVNNYDNMWKARNVYGVRP